MPTFFDQTFFGNTVRDYTALAIAIGLVVLVKRYLSKAIVAVCFNLIKHWVPRIERKHFIDLFMRPLEYFLVLVTFIIATNHLKFPAQLDFTVYKKVNTVVVGGASKDIVTVVSLHTILDTLIAIVLTFSVTWILLRLIDFIAMVLRTKGELTRDKTDMQFVIFFRDFFKAIFIVIGFIVVIRILFGDGLVEKLVAGLGIGAAAMALAAKESIENLIGSFIIFFDKPFHVGDTVKVDSFQGTVEKIGLRSTRIRTLDKTFVTVPNKKMVDSVLDNLSLRTQFRANIRLEIAQAAQPGNLKPFLQDLQQYLSGKDGVEQNYTVNFNDFDKDGYIIQVVYFTNNLNAGDYNQLREDVNMEISRLMDQYQLQLAAKASAG
ncbi:hypothetical protein COR50_06645 [Chitinophaga caeni]|uniref:Mechanosensitive ion channel protein MscS n=1 Tax=Chitinophaga caeni TaxID=2029983 RepID=A0A291QSG8_9BACT|nr:mechanosensitive ion channel domain-containing protein [Chitinophaga caeni]ATL46885.1 hypothetical protein COR50_06645 [Chitinophaga caeni]